MQQRDQLRTPLSNTGTGTLSRQELERRYEQLQEARDKGGSVEEETG